PPIKWGAPRERARRAVPPGGGRPPKTAIPGVFDDDGEGNSLFVLTVWSKSDKPGVRWRAYDFSRTCLAGDSPLVAAKASSGSTQHCITHVLTQQRRSFRCKYWVGSGVFRGVRSRSRFSHHPIARHGCCNACHPQWSCHDVPLTVARLRKTLTQLFD